MKDASMINEPPEYDLPAAVKSAPRIALLGLMTQSTGMCWFGTRSDTIPHGLSAFAIVCVGCPMSITKAQGRKGRQPGDGCHLRLQGPEVGPHAAAMSFAFVPGGGGGRAEALT